MLWLVIAAVYVAAVAVVVAPIVLVVDAALSLLADTVVGPVAGYDHEV